MTLTRLIDSDEIRQAIADIEGEDATDALAGLDEQWPTLRTLVDRPELLRPPEEVVRGLAWRGRAAMLSAPEKSGKSTIVAHAAGALSTGGWWLGAQLAAQARVLVMAPDEAVGDTVRRLHELHADLDHVRILITRPPDPLAALAAAVEIWSPAWVVVDSLAEYSRIASGGRSPDDGDAAGWGGIVRPLVELAHTRDVALTLLHHPRRSDGSYRGSGEIAAAVDAVLEMVGSQQPGAEDPTLRRITGRARWPVEPLAVRMDSGIYVIADAGPGTVSTDAAVLMHVTAHPGCSGAELRRAVGGRAAKVDAAAKALLERGALQRIGGCYWPPEDAEDTEAKSCV